MYSYNNQMTVLVGHIKQKQKKTNLPILIYPTCAECQLDAVFSTAEQKFSRTTWRWPDSKVV